MKRTYEFTSRGAIDLDSILAHYSSIDQKLPERFLRSVATAIGLVCERPRSFPEIRQGIRAVRCEGFPYRVYFDFDDATVAILAIYHTSREPDRWEDANRN